MTTPNREWPREFTPDVRELIVWRDRPLGAGVPWCVPCGEPIRGVVHVHHILFKSRGGDGRPSNGIATHGEMDGEGCHKTKIHDDGTGAGAAGWARSRHARRPAVYQLPVLCAYRGWIVLDDEGGYRPGAGAADQAEQGDH